MKITSIASGNDWWAAYLEKGKVWFHRIVVFTACSDDDGQHYIDAVDAADFADFGTPGVREADNFCGLFHSTDFDEIGVSLNRRAQERFVEACQSLGRK